MKTAFNIQSNHLGPQPVENAEWEPISASDPYPHYPAGEYSAECIGSKCYKDPRFQVWKLRLDFRILDVDNFEQPVCKFFNLGRERKVRQGSDYRRAWILVSGSTPRREDRMSPLVFHGKTFRVRVADTTERWNTKSGKRAEHTAGEIYSQVRELLEVLS